MYFSVLEGEGIVLFFKGQCLITLTHVNALCRLEHGLCELLEDEGREALSLQN